jgi:hypothetical protein
MSAGTAISALFAGAGLFMSYRQYQATIAGGKIQQQAYEAQARNKRLEGRIEAVSAKEKANEILRRAKVALASNIAGGYASAVNPFVGSVDTITKQQILRPAALDVNIQEEEALLAVEKAEREARYLEYRGQMAKYQARSQATSALSMAVIQTGLSGAFSALAPNLSLDLGNKFGMGRSAMTTTPVMGNLAVGSTAAGTTGGLGNLGGGPSFMGI